MNPLLSPSRTDDARSGGEDRALVAAIGAGDANCFETLVRRHGDRLSAITRRMMRCESDAADALQDALISVYRKAHTFDGESKLSTWLHRVTVNACLMRLRSNRRRPELNVDERQPAFDRPSHHARAMRPWDAPPLPSQSAQASELREQVRACIDRLPAGYRAVLMMRDVEELDTDETARRLGCTANCVKTRLHRARGALRELLTPYLAA